MNPGSASLGCHLRIVWSPRGIHGCKQCTQSLLYLPGAKTRRSCVFLPPLYRSPGGGRLETRPGRPRCGRIERDPRRLSGWHRPDCIRHKQGTHCRHQHRQGQLQSQALNGSEGIAKHPQTPTTTKPTMSALLGLCWRLCTSPPLAHERIDCNAAIGASIFSAPAKWMCKLCLEMNFKSVVWPK